jgi:hypothetical protein
MSADTMPTKSDPVLTLDIDWAPDFVIEQVAQILIDRQVKATWFVTHQSAAVEKLRENSDLFELGIHPNMMPGSTHGKTEDQVLSYIKSIVPDAISMRTHGLYQSGNWLMKAAKEYGVLIDVSLFLPRAAYLHPHRINWDSSSIFRAPYFWEDDLEMFEREPIWSVADERLDVNGLRIFDFHPIHVALNTASFADYERLKQIEPIKNWTKDFVAEHVNQGLGPKSLFVGLADQLAGMGRRIRDFLDDGD